MPLIRNPLNLLGALAGAVSLLSLAEDLRLSRISSRLEHWITPYRFITANVEWLVHKVIPRWVWSREETDVFMLFCLLFAAEIRSRRRYRRERDREAIRYPFIGMIYGTMLLFHICTSRGSTQFFLGPLILVFYVCSMLTKEGDNDPSFWLMDLRLIVFVFIVLLLINTILL